MSDQYNVEMTPFMYSLINSTLLPFLTSMKQIIRKYLLYGNDNDIFLLDISEPLTSPPTEKRHFFEVQKQ